MGLVAPPYTRGTWHMASRGREDGGTPRTRHVRVEKNPYFHRIRALPARATCGPVPHVTTSWIADTPRARDMWSLEMPPRWMNEVSPPRGTYGERASLIGSTTRPVTPLAHDMWRADIQRGFRHDCHRCARGIRANGGTNLVNNDLPSLRAVFGVSSRQTAVLLPRRVVSGQGGGRRLRRRQRLLCAWCILGQGSSSLVSISFHLNRVARGFVAMRLAISQVSGARHWMLRHGSAPPGTRPDATRKFRLLAWR